MSCYDFAVKGITSKVVRTWTETVSVGDYPTDLICLQKTKEVINRDLEFEEHPGSYWLKGKLVKYGLTFEPRFATPDFFDHINGNSFPYSPKFLQKNTFHSGIRTLEEIRDDCKIVWVSGGYFSDTTPFLLDDQLNPIPTSIEHEWHLDCCESYVESNEDFFKFLRNHPWVVNKKRIQPVKIGSFPDITKSVKVLVRPDPETYKQMWDFYANESCPYRYVKQAVSGYLYAMELEGKDWFGIRPFLKNPPKG